MYVKNDEPEKTGANQESRQGTSGGSKIVLTVISLLCLVLLVGGLVGVVVYFTVLDDDNNNDNAEDDVNNDTGDDGEDDFFGGDLVVDFDNAEFDLFQFLAICQEIEQRAITAELDEQNITFGLAACFGGHRVTCETEFLFVSGFHCPTVVGGDCVCDQGSLNLFDGRNFQCGIDLIDEEYEDYLEAYYDNIESCVPASEGFEDLAEIIEASNANQVDGDEAGLDFFNTYVELCQENWTLFEAYDEAEGDDFSVIFTGCLNQDVQFVCDTVGYDLNAIPCADTPGEVIPVDDDDDDNYGGIVDVTVDFDIAEFDLFQFLAICQEIEQRNITADLVDQDITSGLSTCYNGHLLRCDTDVFFANAVHCPIVFGGACACDDGSLNLIDLSGGTFECGIDLDDEAYEDVLLNYYYNLETCVPAVVGFTDIDDIVQASNAAAVGGDVAGLEFFNTFVQVCQFFGNWNLLDSDDPENVEVLFGCLNTDVQFRCDTFGYSLVVGGCTDTPGDLIPVSAKAFAHPAVHHARHGKFIH